MRCFISATSYTTTGSHRFLSVFARARALKILNFPSVWLRNSDRHFACVHFARITTTYQIKIWNLQKLEGWGGIEPPEFSKHPWVITQPIWLVLQRHFASLLLPKFFQFYWIVLALINQSKLSADKCPSFYLLSLENLWNLETLISPKFHLYISIIQK